MEFVDRIKQIGLQFACNITSDAEADSGCGQSNDTQKKQSLFAVARMGIRGLVHNYSVLRFTLTHNTKITVVLRSVPSSKRYKAFHELA